MCVPTHELCLDSRRAAAHARPLSLRVPWVPQMLRNKYCGKGGLFYDTPGGSCAENLPTAVYCGTDDPFCGQLQTSDVSAQVRREAAARARAAAPQPENKFERISGLAIPSMPELPSMPSLPSF